MLNITTNVDFEKMVPLNSEGKNSTVYTFYDKQLGENFIVKKIEKQLIFDDLHDLNEDNLFYESCILYKVKHPNIMEIQYASQDDNCVYMVMPLCKKGSLNSIINNRYLTVREIVKYSLEFLSGLHYVHANKLIHFDIKPTNILINDNGKAILTDFGLSKYININGLASPNKAYCAHIPPEYFDYNLLSSKSDIYQAGITMYRMCNGNEIFDEQYLKYYSDIENSIKQGKFPDRKYYLPHIPLKLKQIINKCMSIDPDERYETVLDIINDLAKVEKNLDWVYEIIDDDHQIWKKLNESKTHYDCIELFYNGHTFTTKGKKINIAKNSSTKINNWNKDSIIRTNVFKTVASLING
jgi:serine/threonine protein kinase